MCADRLLTPRAEQLTLSAWSPFYNDRCPWQDVLGTHLCRAISAQSGSVGKSFDSADENFKATGSWTRTEPSLRWYVMGETLIKIEEMGTGR